MPHSYDTGNLSSNVYYASTRAKVLSFSRTVFSRNTFIRLSCWIKCLAIISVFSRLMFTKIIPSSNFSQYIKLMLYLRFNASFACSLKIIILYIHSIFLFLVFQHLLIYTFLYVYIPETYIYLKPGCHALIICLKALQGSHNLPAR